jgi:ADP-ribose pyrophosphatase YjhB (NUDIX family)
VGVGAVILDGAGRVLLVKHHPSDSPRKHFWKGKWICPGGMLDFGEGLEEGARREVREETGLEIDIVRALPPADRLILWKGTKYLQVVYIDFLARVRKGAPEKGGLVTVRTGDDVGTARWFSEKELEGLGDELHEDTRALLVRAVVMDSLPG